MANLSVTNTFTAATVISSSQVNTNYSDIVNYINNQNNVLLTITALTATGAATLTSATLSSTLAVTGLSTLTGGVANLFGYRKPNLSFISVTAVDVEANTGTSNQTTIVFPDGTVRSVTEDTSSTDKYRRFIITAVAEFTSGTEDSGLRSGITEATNTWYAIYAVKSTINTANFVLAGDTTLPLQANFATLNSRYGTNGWVYLGMIRNGDNSGATGDILSFFQSSGYIQFSNTATINGGISSSFGLRLASATSSSVTYTYSAGTGTTDIPNHIKIGTYGGGSAQTTSSFTGAASSGSPVFWGQTFSTTQTDLSASALVFLTSGCIVQQAGTAAMGIMLRGFFDPILGVGINPIL